LIYLKKQDCCENLHSPNKSLPYNDIFIQKITAECQQLGALYVIFHPPTFSDGMIAGH
jgi:hypothetical protein